MWLQPPPPEQAPYAAVVHTFNGHPNKEFPIFAWESRYVGNVRAVNAALIDAYMLKSLDGGFADDSVSALNVSAAQTCTLEPAPV